MKYSKPFSLSIEPLTAFVKLSCGRRDFAKAEGHNTEKEMVGRVVEREGEGKNILRLQNGVTWQKGPKRSYS